MFQNTGSDLIFVMKKEGVLHINGRADIIPLALSGFLPPYLAGGRDRQEHDEGSHDDA
ncbi:MAG: hypothetical protein METHSR3v1_1720010 [Methanothrix sp.]|nr:MAG: hypothetical protein METHSR3v1_1720010 [Methanothrix sp.]